MPYMIRKADANLMVRSEHRYPRKGDQCNASCAFYFACTNSRDYQDCRGFQLIDGEALDLLQRNIGYDNVQYIKNSYNFIENALSNGHAQDGEIVLRSIDGIQELTHLKSKPVERNFPQNPEKQTPKKFTLIGMEVYEIKENGQLSIPDPPKPPPKIPDLEPECMIMLRMNDQKRGEKEK